MTLLPITPPPAALWKEVRNTDMFPVLQETRERIRHHLQQAKVSFDELAPVIESDPALCMNLLMLAARQHPGCVEQISGAASCLSLLGMQELVRLMKHVEVINITPEDDHQQVYRRAVLCSRLAGNLAAEWAAIKGTPTISYARWSTMLTMAPFWAWLKHWPAAANWLYLLSQGQDMQRATHTLFGNDEKHWLLIMRHLHMPVMAQEVYISTNKPTSAQWRLLRRTDPRDLDNQRPLIHICQAPAMISLMANQLAWQLHIAPYGSKAWRWIVLTSHWLGKPVHQIAPRVRQLQLQTSRQQQSTLGTGVHLLLSPQTERELYPWIATDADTAAAVQPAETALVAEPAQPLQTESATAEPPAETAPAEAPAAAGDDDRHSDDAYMKKLLYQLQQEPDSFGDWHFLMKSMLKGVTRGLGLPHACVALLNKDKTLLKTIYAEGLPDSAPIRGLAVDLTSPSLFSKILEKPAGVMLSPANREKFLARLPNTVTRIMPQQAVIMSINAGARPIGVVIGYTSTDADAVSEHEYMGFKNLCLTTSKSLAALKANTRKK